MSKVNCGWQSGAYKKGAFTHCCHMGLSKGPHLNPTWSSHIRYKVQDFWFLTSKPESLIQGLVYWSLHTN